MVHTSRHQHAIRVNSQSVDDSVVTRQVLDKVAIWKHPLLDVVSRASGKGVSVKRVTTMLITILQHNMQCKN